MTTRTLLRTAGVLAWIFAGIPALLGVARDPDCMPRWGHPIWLGAFVVAAIAGRESAARRALAEAQHELEQSSRDRERVRIARELHDLLGHQLVALHLNLEAAKHQAPSAPLEAAGAIAKGLLDDVRK